LRTQEDKQPLRGEEEPLCSQEEPLRCQKSLRSEDESLCGQKQSLRRKDEIALTVRRVVDRSCSVDEFAAHPARIRRR
jgi:hypothetical protein